MLGRGVLNVPVSNLPTKIAQTLLATVTMMPRMHQPRELQPINMAPTFRVNKRSAYHHHRIRLGRSRSVAVKLPVLVVMSRMLNPLTVLLITTTPLQPSLRQQSSPQLAALWILCHDGSTLDTAIKSIDTTP